MCHSQSHPRFLGLLPLWLVFLLTACAAPLSLDPARIDIPSAYGIEAWDQVEAIRFTMQRDAGGRRTSSKWVWEPGPDRVTAFDSFDRPETWSRGSVPDQHRARSAAFENDLRWLLFPLSLSWDTSLTVVDRGAAAGPIGGAPARWIQVLEPGAGLAGPGYDLFVDDLGVVREWIIRGPNGESLETATWSTPVLVGPISLSLDHFEIDGSYRISFPDVAVKLKDQDRWIPAAR